MKPDPEGRRLCEDARGHRNKKRKKRACCEATRNHYGSDHISSFDFHLLNPKTIFFVVVKLLELEYFGMSPQGTDQEMMHIVLHSSVFVTSGIYPEDKLSLQSKRCKAPMCCGGDGLMGHQSKGDV